MAEYKLGRIKFVYQGAWAGNTGYVVDDVVTVSGKTYICVLSHTSTNTTGGFATDLSAIPTNWNLVADGAKWTGIWAATTYYNVGDLVQWGATVYICKTAHTSATYTSPTYLGLENDQSKWDAFAANINWSGAWATTTRYKVRDLIYYGGVTYICNTAHISATTAAAGLENDQSKWDTFNQGITYLGEWSGSSVRYKLNDVVKHGADLWICTTQHTSTGVTIDTANFAVFVNGFEAANSWTNSTNYQIGDMVTYGGNTYTAILNNINQNPVSATSYWQLFTTGLSFAGDWSSSTAYRIGQVVRLGGYTYVATADNTSSSPPNLTYWQRLNSGLRWNPNNQTFSAVSGTNIVGSGTSATFNVTATKTLYTVTVAAGGTGYAATNTIKILGTSLGGLSPANDLTLTVSSVSGGVIQSGGVTASGISVTWVSGTTYVAGDLVLWAVSTYICVSAHTGGTGNRPDNDTSGTYWNLFSSGTEQAVMTTQGDMFYFAASGPARLPIGTDGQVLRVNNNIPTWQYYGQINNLVYVALSGTDATANGQGTTVDKPWATVRYAAQQIEDGYLNTNAKTALTINKQFLLKETNNYVLNRYSYTITTSTSTTFTAPGGCSTMYVGMPIVFTGTVGGVTAGTTYWVNSVPSSTTFTVTSSQYSGITFGLNSSSGSMTGTFVYSQTKTERDAGYAVDGVIFDLSHGGNFKTYTNAQAYFSAATTLISGVVASDLPPFIASLGYLGTTLMPAVLSNTAPGTNYQALNAPNIVTTGASGTSTVATITFATQASAYAVGSYVTVAGVTPTGYNGTYLVTASTTGSVSYASTTTGSQTVAGTVAATRAIQNTTSVATASIESGTNTTCTNLIAIITNALSALNTGVIPALANPNTTIRVMTGTYNEVLPIVLPAYTAVVGDELRSTTIQPSKAIANLANDKAKSIVAMQRVQSIIPNIIANTSVTVTSTGVNPNTQTQVTSLPIGDVGSSTAVASVTSNTALIQNMIFNGLSQTPAFTLPTVTGYNTTFLAGYGDGKAQIVQNYLFIKSEIANYLINNYSATWTAMGATYQYETLRDVGFILDGLQYDLTYGGNVQSNINGSSYYSLSISQVQAPYAIVFIQALTRLKAIMSNIVTAASVSPSATNAPYTATQVLSGTAGSAGCATAAQGLIQNIINWINNAAGDTTVYPTAAVALTSAQNQNSFNAIASRATEIASDAQVWVQKYYQAYAISTSLTLRDSGYIVQALQYDMVFGSNFNSLSSGRAYNRLNTSALNLLANQNNELNATLDSINFIGNKTRQIAAGGATVQAQTTIDDIVNIINGQATTTLTTATTSTNVLTVTSTAGMAVNMPITFSGLPANTTTTVSGTTTSTNVITLGATVASLGIAAGQQVYFTGVVVGNLVQNQMYYVINPTGSTIQVSLTFGGSAVALVTATPGGTMNAVVNKAGGIWPANIYWINTIPSATTLTITSSFKSGTAYVITNTVGSMTAGVVAGVSNSTGMSSSYQITNGTLAYNGTLTTINAAEILRANTNFIAYEASAYIGANYGGTVTATTVTTASITGYISGTTLTVSSVVSGTVAIGMTLSTITGAADGTYITAGSGSVWTVSVSQTLASSGTPVALTLTNYVVTSGTHKFVVGDPVIFTGTVAGGIALSTPYYVCTVPSTTTFTLSTVQSGYGSQVPAVLTGTTGQSFTVAYYYSVAKCVRDTTSFINALIYDLNFTGNYKSMRATELYLSAVTGSQLKNMFQVRNGCGLRNMTMSGLTGTLTVANTYGTKRPTAGAYSSLDPGFGPNDANSWIYGRSCYTQNCTMFGTGCVGGKVDGSLHAGGYRSMVANDYTTILSDGIGYWVTGNGSLTELVSVFCYFSYSGYLAELGGRIRATNGNSSYGTYGVIAEGTDTFETSLYGNLNNRYFGAQITNTVTDATNQVLRLEFSNAGSGYTNSVTTVSGAGVSPTTLQDEFRDAAVFETRITDPNNTGSSGGTTYVTAANTGQSNAVGAIANGPVGQFVLAATDIALTNAYAGMRVQITAGTGVGQYANILTYTNSTKIAQIYKDSFTNLTVTGSTTTVLQVASTATLYLNMPIYLSATTAGVLTANTVYYVKTIPDGVTFTVSLTSGGAAITGLTATSSQTITLYAAGWDHIVPATPIATTTDLTSAYIVEPRISYTAPGFTSTTRAMSNTATWTAATYAAPGFVAVASGGTTASYSTTGKTWTATSVLPASTNWVDVTYGGGQLAKATATVGGLGGTGAVLTAVLGTGSASTQVVRVTVVNGGYGYTTPPTIVFAGGGGAGAAATATVLDGTIQSVTMTITGSGYSSVPTAVAYTGTVTNITVNTWGKDYFSTPTVTFSPPVYATAWVASATATLNAYYSYYNSVTFITNYYQATVGGIMSASAPSHTSGSAANGAATLLYVGTLATVRGASNPGLSNNGVSSYTLTQGGYGYTSTPTITITDSSSAYWAISGNANNSAYITANALAVTLTLTATTQGTPSFVTVASTASLSTNMPFTVATTVGGLTAGTVYFVIQILSATTFTVAATSGGVELTTAITTTSSQSVTLSGAWQAGASTSKTDLKSIAYGNGTYVAVGGTSGTASAVSATSPTTAWIDRSSTITALSAGYYSDVVYGNGYFVAINYGGTITSISSNGVAWSAGGVLPATKNWVGLAYGNGRFVAIATDGTTATCINIDKGSSCTWTATNAGLPSAVTTWSNLRYGQGVFMAIATGTTVCATSPDGLDWTSRALQASSNWLALTFGNPATTTLGPTPIWVAISNTSGTTANSIRTGATPLGRVKVVGASVTEIRMAEPGSGYAKGNVTSITTTSSGTLLVDDTTNLSTSTNTQPVEFSVSAGNITTNTTYYVIGSSVVANTSFQVSATSGSATPVALTAATPTSMIYTVGPVVTITDPNKTIAVSTRVRTGFGALANPSFSNRGTGNSTATSSTIGDGYSDLYQNSQYINVSNLFAMPQPGANLQFGTVYTGVPWTASTVVRAGIQLIATNTITSGGVTTYYYNVYTVTATGTTGTSAPTSTAISVSDGTATLTYVGQNPNVWYKLVAITNQLGIAGAYTAQFQINPALTTNNAPAHNIQITTRLKYSQVRLTGHDYLYIGSGNQTQTNYPYVTTANSIQANQQLATAGGRVFFTATDQDGNFNVGNLFGVQQATGTATLNASAFNLAGLQSLTLGAVTLGIGSATITQFSTDPYFTANSDNILPTQKAIKSFITAQIGGGSSTLNVNTLTAGQIFIANNSISNTTGGQIYVSGKMNFTGGIDGAPVALVFFAQR
jgi:hypothetical protein